MTYGPDVVSALVTVGAVVCLGAYIAATSRQLATKAHVAGLASRVEAISDAIRIQEEALRAAVERDVAALEGRFRLELPIYRDMWDDSLRVDVALGRIRRTNGARRAIEGPSHRAAYDSLRCALELLQTRVREFGPFVTPEVALAILAIALPQPLDADGVGAVEGHLRGLITAVELLRSDLRDRLRADVRAVERLIVVQQARGGAGGQTAFS